jgi:hypothetical protein
MDEKICRFVTLLAGLLKGAYTHGCDPTTARHGNFWLLGFLPGPIRSSLDNLNRLDLPNFSNRSMLMPSLMRTPVQRKRRSSRTSSLKPSTTSNLPETGLDPADRVLL